MICVCEVTVQDQCNEYPRPTQWWSIATRPSPVQFLVFHRSFKQQGKPVKVKSPWQLQKASRKGVSLSMPCDGCQTRRMASRKCGTEVVLTGSAWSLIQVFIVYEFWSTWFTQQITNSKELCSKCLTRCYFGNIPEIWSSLDPGVK